MNMVKKKIGIIGGTFNPIHYGHLIAAEFAREAFALDRIIFVPSARPPHKNLGEILDSRHRLAMVELAIRDNPAFCASSLEIDRQGMSYSVETVAAIQQMHREAGLFFILGIDAFMLMNTWKDPDRLAEMCSLIVVTRPGYEMNPEDECFAGIPLLMWQKLEVISIPGFEISSSAIRIRAAGRKTIKYLLPPEVEDYINSNRLYWSTSDDCQL
ncbi:MAG: nicotinate-nucleotide adenylyltransferase [Syntrophomonas sp.]|nr:nicotinate-nucleotide adenylyltransferase [Syntrophomonas sp.]